MSFMLQTEHILSAFVLDVVGDKNVVKLSAAGQQTCPLLFQVIKRGTFELCCNCANIAEIQDIGAM